MADEPERLFRTRLLLETLFDYLPRAGRSAIQSLSGPAPSRYVPCGVCHGKGRVLLGQKRRLCQACEGQGWRRRRRGEPTYDDYTGEQVGTEDVQAPVRCMTAAELTAAISRIERDQAEREGRVAPNDELPWVRKQDAQWNNGDYKRLLWALDFLSPEHPVEMRALWHYYVLGWDYPSEMRDKLIERGLRMLASHMPHEIRVPPWYLPDPQAQKSSTWRGRTMQHEKARGIRNDEIRQRVANGDSISALAREYNLSRRHIQRVVRIAA